jgi:hypothetical protein
MTGEVPSHFNDLLADASRLEEFHDGRFLESVTPSLVPRTDHGKTIFQEGCDYSGFETQSDAQSCLTVQVAPFALASVDRHEFEVASRKVIGEGSTMPLSMDNVKYVVPHVIAWWRREDAPDDGRNDLLKLSQASTEHKESLYDVVGRQMDQGARVIQEVTGTVAPIVQGSWGHATPEERAMQGKSRGGPTNKHGHLHILDLNGADLNASVREDLPVKDRLDHYGVWNARLHDKFKEPIARVLGKSVEDYMPDVGSSVVPFVDLTRGENGNTLCTYGYNLSFEGDGIDSRGAFAAMAKTGEVMQAFYSQLTEHYDTYQKTASTDEAATKARNAMQDEATKVGFTHEEGALLADFALGIRPTYGQLLSWREELANIPDASADLERIEGNIERYERMAQKLGSIAEDHPLISGIISDTLADPSEKSISRVWPVHMGASFYMDKLRLEGEGLRIKNIMIVPNIDTTKASQNITGTINRRPTEAEVVTKD